MPMLRHRCLLKISAPKGADGIDPCWWDRCCLCCAHRRSLRVASAGACSLLLFSMLLRAPAAPFPGHSAFMQSRASILMLRIDAFLHFTLSVAATPRVTVHTELVCCNSVFCSPFGQPEILLQPSPISALIFFLFKSLPLNINNTQIYTCLTSHYTI